MTVHLVIAFLFIAAMAALAKKVSLMSASTDSLASSVALLSDQVAMVAAAIQSLKALPKPDPADVAAVDKAVSDIQKATATLQAAIA